MRNGRSVAPTSPVRWTSVLSHPFDVLTPSGMSRATSLVKQLERLPRERHQLGRRRMVQ